MSRALAAFGAALVLLLTACESGAAPPGESNVEVDTPQLREQKAAAGIEPCEPGTGSGGELPDLTLPCLGGGSDVDLSTLRGPLLLNVWWSGCGPCVREMPVLQQLHDEDGDVHHHLGVSGFRRSARPTRSSPTRAGRSSTMPTSGCRPPSRSPCWSTATVASCSSRRSRSSRSTRPTTSSASTWG